MKENRKKQDEDRFVPIEEFMRRTKEKIQCDVAKRGWANPNEFTVIIVRKGSHPGRGR